MLHKLVILTLIEDVGREPLISPNFSYGGSAYHELRELGILESQFIHLSVSVDRLSPLNVFLSPSNKKRSSLLMWDKLIAHVLKKSILQMLISHLFLPWKIRLCILLRLPKGREETSPRDLVLLLWSEPGVRKCLLKETNKQGKLALCKINQKYHLDKHGFELHWGFNLA